MILIKVNVIVKFEYRIGKVSLVSIVFGYSFVPNHTMLAVKLL